MRQVAVKFPSVLVAWIAATIACRITPLGHEPGNDTMEYQIIVETLLSQINSAGDMHGRRCVEQAKAHLTQVGGQVPIVISVGLKGHQERLSQVLAPIRSLM